MSVDIVDGEFRVRIERLLSSPRQTVWLASPFFTYPIARWLATLPAAKQGDRRLLVSWAPSSIESFYLSAAGVDLLRTSGFAVRNMLRLHAKLVVADDQAYVGSANLTSFGMNAHNVEIGAFARGASAAKARELFEPWWEEAVPLTKSEIARAVKRQKQLAKRHNREVDYEAQPGYRPPIVKSAAQRVWVKSLHYDEEDWTIAPGEETWIGDPGWRDAQGQRIYRKDKQPAGEPGYKVGDKICIYFGTVMKVPLIVEVLKPPKFAPKQVQQEHRGHEPDAGERWPWLTWVKGLSRIPIGDAPDIDDLGIRGPITRGLPHFRLPLEQYERVELAFRERL